MRDPDSAAALVRALRAQLTTARADAFREAADAFPMELNDKHGEAVRKAFRNRILALADQPAASGWRDIATADKARVHPAADTGPALWLRLGDNWSSVGWFCWESSCWRYEGDDGVDDTQPTHWQPLPAAPEALANAE